jgi:hypothetical protein
LKCFRATRAGASTELPRVYRGLYRVPQVPQKILHVQRRRGRKAVLAGRVVCVLRGRHVRADKVLRRQLLRDLLHRRGLREVGLLVVQDSLQLRHVRRVLPRPSFNDVRRERLPRGLLPVLRPARVRPVVRGAARPGRKRRLFGRGRSASLLSPLPPEIASRPLHLGRHVQGSESALRTENPPPL